MRPAIVVIDYGAGNIASVRRALEHIGANVTVAQRSSDVSGADGLVIPGVGHFRSTAAIDDRWREAIVTFAASKPLLGVCVGLQFLFDGSDEAPDAPGLGLFRGRCFRLPPTGKVPHVGWNTVEIGRSSRLFDDVGDDAAFYFTHSFAAPVGDACIGRTCHGDTFASAVERANVMAVQFHPEKSGSAGLRLLRNWVAQC